jgi:hypothetical protein
MKKSKFTDDWAAADALDVMADPFLAGALGRAKLTTERLVAPLGGIGIDISKRQVVRLLTSRLDDLIAEDQGGCRPGCPRRPG